LLFSFNIISVLPVPLLAGAGCHDRSTPSSEI